MLVEDEVEVEAEVEDVDTEVLDVDIEVLILVEELVEEVEIEELVELVEVVGAGINSKNPPDTFVDSETLASVYVMA